ncbi:SDR family NAD(P)-dependent oxidoreductase [Parahaliea mediterranea]|uniref:SDR family NAD(P)-dependent oxidoreductase n=1 Tax=Parahaliea mediterranea TaxID=651086 RepID=A0A939IP19_9GAMM|nr:SDR family NAD(P)-dependent oxidoreductase [Parahaliea mediterranea]MBN7798617.1 SDR family NAD(P)-dependent oxidoreductase [Parahaliea mediterranea]
MPENSKRFEFTDAVVWITGASSGIGAALAREMGRRGARLVLSARRESQLQAVRGQCVDAGVEDAAILVLPLDVERHELMPAAVTQVLERFGRIDLLVNNAGLSQRSLCIDTDLAVYKKLIDVDLLGQIALTKAVLPTMVAQGSGTLAVTSSVAGKVGAPLRTGYCAVKHGVMGFFDALRVEIAHLGLNVTTIVPGSIRTAVAHNALAGDGTAFNRPDEAIEEGMDVDDCARVIADGFAGGVEEIAVGEGPEMQLLDMKRQDPTATFRLLETMAADLIQRKPPPMP